MSAVVTICNLYRNRDASWFSKDRLALFFSMLNSAYRLDAELGNPECKEPWVLEFIAELDDLDAGGYRGADCD